jgi:tetratricopeptide (TPR) repeat protein
MRRPPLTAFATVLVAALSILAVLVTASLSLAAEPMTRAQEKAMTEIFAAGQQGGTLHKDGRFAEAEKVFRDVLAKVDANFPGEALMRAASLHNLAGAVADQGRLEEARKLAADALDLRVKNGAVPPAIANSQALLGSILRDLGKRAEATDLMSKAVTALLGSKEASPQDLISHAADLVGMLAEDGAIDKGDALAGDLVNLLPQLADEQKVDVYWAAARLASVKGKLADADRNYRQAYASLTKALPNDVLRRSILLANIASILRQQFRPAEAEALFARAATDLETLFPKGHPALASALDGLGLCIAEQQRPADAWPVQRRALDMRLALLPKDHPLIATSLLNLGLSLMRAGQFAPARDALQSAVDRRQAAHDEVGAARAAVSLAAAQQAMGDGRGGVKSLDNARAVFTTGLPAGHPFAVTAAINEAWLLLGLGETGKALTVAREAAGALIAARELASRDEPEAVPPDEDKRRIVVRVAAAWETARAGKR